MGDFGTGESSYVHMGPPCGTASRARGRKISKGLRRRGAPEPQPLRDGLRPEGKPGLNPFDQRKVDSANKIYQFCAQVSMTCLNRGIGSTIENPTNSLFWLMPCIVDILAHEAVKLVKLHACMWGSTRKKKSSQLEL